MWQLGTPPLELVARTTVVYAAFFVALRIFGKREVGQFTFFDLALILLAANALQPAMTGPDNSVTGGLIILATIFVENTLVSIARERIPLVRRLLESEPTVLAKNGIWDTAALEREGVDDNDIAAALREHGVEKVEDTKLVVLEQDGSISVVPAEGSKTNRPRRRLRYRHPR